MAIKFTDDKGEGKPAKAEVERAKKAPEPAAPEPDQDAQLPFAKPVRPEKKRRGR